MDIERVAGTSLFRHVKKEGIEPMLRCLNAYEKQFQKGDFIISVNDNPHLIGIVLDGSVQMVNEDLWGNKSLLTLVEKDGIFGETYACARENNALVSFVANEDTTILLLDYFRVLHSCTLACVFHHRLIENMVSMIADKNLLLIEKINVTSKLMLRDKILTYLGRQAQIRGEKTFEIPLGRVKLAEYLCVDRSALTRELARMKQEGIIDFDKNRFTLLT